VAKKGRRDAFLSFPSVGIFAQLRNKTPKDAEIGKGKEIGGFIRRFCARCLHRE